MTNPMFIIDPTGHFTEKAVPRSAIVEACGLLPAFCIGDKPTIAENLAANYQFHMGWTPPQPASVDIETGVFTFPDDPPLHPLLKVEGENEQVYIYHHGIVAQVLNNEFVGWTRMD